MPDRFDRRGGYRPEPEPKPFGKIAVTRGKAQNDLVGHDKFKHHGYTGKMTCRLTALTPIHIGSGIYELGNDSPVRGLITSNGEVVVPGTSLKGAIRSISEAISDSCLRIVREEIKRSLAIGQSRPCDEIKSRHRESARPKRNEKLCVSCSIFGGLGYQGRVSFTDARLVSGGTAIHQIQSPYPPRDSARFYKDAQRRFNGRKFYHHGEPVASQRGEPYQVITVDSELEFTTQFESLAAEEFCLLLVAMGVLDDIVIKIGGGKQAMLGSVEIMPTHLELRYPRRSFVDFSEAEEGCTEEVTKDIPKYLLEAVGKASQLVNEDALDQLLKIWEWPSDRKAPMGMY